MPLSAGLRTPRLYALKRPAILLAAVLAVTSVGVLSGPAARTNNGVAETSAVAAPATPLSASSPTYYGRQSSVNGYNWSGVLVPQGSFSSVSSSWTEPAVRCKHRRDVMAPWVGIDGQNNNSVEQTGIETSCESGKARYRAWYEMYPAPAVYYRNPVRAGDKITASVTRRGSRYTMTLTDHTQHWSRTTTRTHHTGHSSAEVVLESPSEAYPTFGTISFGQTKVNGHAVSHYSLYRMHASSKHGTQNHTSLVSGRHFSISYRRE